MGIYRDTCGGLYILHTHHVLRCTGYKQLMNIVISSLCLDHWFIWVHINKKICWHYLNTHWEKLIIILLIIAIIKLSTQANTYQAIAITDGLLHSYAVFIYECGGIQWGADVANGLIFARVGVSVGGSVISSHPLSGSNGVDTIDCLNTPSSRWVNLIYDISLTEPSNTSEPLPQTTSVISSSPVPTESSQFYSRVSSSNSLLETSQFKASQLTHSGAMLCQILINIIIVYISLPVLVPNSVDGKKSQILNSISAVPNPSPSLSPYFPPQTGTISHN